MKRCNEPLGESDVPNNRLYDDPRHPERQVGLVKTAPLEYDRPLTRIAVRTRKKNQQWGVGVLISTLPQCAPFVLGLGIMQLIRDVLHINSQVVYDKFHTIKVIKFNSLDQMARKLQFAFQSLFDPEHLDIILDKT